MRFAPPLYAVLLIPALLASCAPKLLTRKRPGGVPASATWVDGADGGTWIDCHKIAGDAPRFDCAIFNVRTGAPYAKGVFAPDFDPNGIPLHFTVYDGGGRITLSDTTHFRADGVVDFPTGDGHGHAMKYRFGDPVGRDSTY
jgi:hypothetical protein